MAASLRTVAIAVEQFCICNSLSCQTVTPDLTLVSLLCGGEEYPGENLPYANSITYVIQHIILDTPINGFDYYFASLSAPNIVYGHGACDQRLSENQCRDCPFYAFSRVLDCPVLAPIGFQVKLQDCRFSLSCWAGQSVPDVTVLSFICNTQGRPQDPKLFGKSVSYIWKNLPTETPEHGFDYYTTSPYTQEVVYAHGVCNGRLSNDQCTTCLLEAFHQVFQICIFTPIGVQMKLQDCRIRYENYPFAE
ncbi:hypothetical protein CDL15_Pgr007403 [Punica granatum]|uniref:Gnk2-homologous domain-containing protein n=1 Tax=Punica granatum TaxID=22663 RepID=A0A218X833_PUNGR|nr:hypothetical protein CDL15_Pgr007403 [Punica granatum]